MNQNLSRVIFALEAVLIVLPISCLFAMYVLPERPMPDPMFAVRRSVAVVLIAAALLCGWFLAFKFAFQGRAGLRGTSWLWWIAPALTAAIVVGSVLKWLTLTGKSDLSLDVGFYFALGVPLLLPLAHLGFERWPLQRRPTARG